MKIPVFTGYGLMLVTPMTDLGQISYPRLQALIDLQVENGAAALFVGGTAGQGNLLLESELIGLIARSAQYAAGRAKIVACTGRPGTQDTIALSRRAQEAGADAVMVISPYYIKASHNGLVAHYKNVADALRIPVIVGDCPPRTGVYGTPKLYYDLSGHENINGVKEINTHELPILTETLALCGDDFHVWTGADSLIAASMALGAKGAVSILGNLMPAMISKLVRACQAGDYPAAAALQIRHVELMRRLFVETHPIPIITAMNLAGMGAGPMRLPLCPLEPEHEQMLARAMRASGFDV